MNKKTQTSYDPRCDDSLLELTPYEQDLEDNFKHQTRIENYDKVKEMIVETAKTHHATKKMISIRVQEEDLMGIKKKAKELGMPYQKLINMLIHMYTQDQIILHK